MNGAREQLLAGTGGPQKQHITVNRGGPRHLPGQRTRIGTGAEHAVDVHRLMAARGSGLEAQQENNAVRKHNPHARAQADHVQRRLGNDVATINTQAAAALQSADLPFQTTTGNPHRAPADMPVEQCPAKIAAGEAEFRRIATESDGVAAAL